MEPEKEKDQHTRDLYAQIGQSVTELRQYHGITLEEAAEMAHLTNKKLAAIERGVLYNNVNHIAKIIEALGGRLAIIPEESPTDPHCQFVELADD
jgi:hypothetical protein